VQLQLLIEAAAECCCLLAHLRPLHTTVTRPLDPEWESSAIAEIVQEWTMPEAVPPKAEDERWGLSGTVSTMPEAGPPKAEAERWVQAASGTVPTMPEAAPPKAEAERWIQAASGTVPTMPEAGPTALEEKPTPAAETARPLSGPAWLAAWGSLAALSAERPLWGHGGGSLAAQWPEQGWLAVEAFW